MLNKSARNSLGPTNALAPMRIIRLEGHAWIGVDDGSMLDVEGAELLLVGAGADDVVGAHMVSRTHVS